MVLGVFQATIVDAVSNRIVPLATVSVVESVTLAAPELFMDRDGLIPLTNPFAADENGFARFYVVPARYNIMASGFSGAASSWVDVVISSAASIEGGGLTTQVAPIVGGALDLSDSGISVWQVEMSSNVTAITLPTNDDPTQAIAVTIIFSQGVGGGYSVGGWPAVSWEGGLIPLIDTSSSGKTTVQFLLLSGKLPLGVS